VCPLCITTTVLIAGGVASTGKLAARARKKAGAKKASHPAPPAPSGKGHPDRQELEAAPSQVVAAGE